MSSSESIPRSWSSRNAIPRTLDLLPDVPVGKLVVSASRVTTRDQVLELERAGVDAVLLGDDLASAFPHGLAELTGRL